MPYVSVIVPVYNSRNGLTRCLDSIVAQTFQDFECILIDDGSTDGSGSICEKYSINYQNFVFVHKKNGGVSSARNRGLLESKGEYIVFVDSDDFIEPTYLEHLIDTAKMTHADLIIQGFKKQVGSSLQEVGALDFVCDKADSLPAVTWSLLLKQGLINSVWGKAFRKRMIESCFFSETSSWGEDTAFLLKAISPECIVCFDPKKNYIYRFSETGLDRRFDMNKPKYMQEYYSVLLDFTKSFFGNDKAWNDAVNLKVSQEMLRSIFGLVNTGENVRVKDYLKQLFGCREINRRFTKGALLDDNPLILKIASFVYAPYFWARIIGYYRRKLLKRG